MAKKKKTKLKAKMGGKRTAIMLLDVEIPLYHCVLTNHEEVQVEGTNEWTMRVNVDDVIDELDARISEWKTILRAKAVVLAFGATANWRKRILPEYKANRGKKPLGYNATVEFLKDKYEWQCWDFLEADDVIGLLASDPKRANENIVVVSEDKDFRSIPGIQLHDPRHYEEQKQLILRIDELEADRWWMGQTLTGDTADNYKGCPGVGKVGAAKILKDCTSLAEMWDAVVAEYKKKDLTKLDAMVQAQVARILRHGDYDFETGRLNLWKPPKVRKGKKS